jgi:myo-inositol 2-dehydrogenase / D-chiro-inositol 1-dehydrogenase
MGGPIGVGFLGAGPVTQAIHLPTLATMPDRFRVARVMDINRDVSSAVAARCDAASSVAESEVYDDPLVEIVVVCSPNAAHARQIIASCRAGKRVVLCEKPLAVTRAEGDDIARVARETNTPIIVGTMHAYDPAYRAAYAAWKELEESASFVQSSIYLPANGVFINQATDQVELPAAAPAQGSRDSSDPAFQAMMIRNAMLGLAIHNVPLIRELYPSVGQMLSARFLRPFGYALAMRREEQAASLQALMPGTWPPYWNLRAIGQKNELNIAFPPSYVLAGSSRSELIAWRETRVFQAPQNGYQAMWMHVGEIAAGAAEPSISLDAIVADLCFAFDLADGAEEILTAKK